MPVLCEFINIIIPIAKIDDVYPGGFRDGAMNPIDAEEAVRYWQSYGLKSHRTTNGQKEWADLCVVAHPFRVAHPCPWLIYDFEKGYAVHKNDSNSEIIGPGNKQFGMPQ